jgi:transcriptional regulator with XRE-family HTH domain
MPEVQSWLKAARTARGLSQSELARKVGAQQAQISQWERGSARPNPATEEKLRTALEVDDPSQFVETAAPPPSPYPWWDEALARKDSMQLKELAALLGVPLSTLMSAFKQHGVSRQPKVSARVEAEPEVEMSNENTESQASIDARHGSKDGNILKHAHLLGKIPDAEVAKLSNVSVRTIASFRARNKIPGYKGPRRRTPSSVGGRRASRLESFMDILGKVPDRVVADKAEMSLGAVRNFRIKHGISASGRVPESATLAALDNAIPFTASSGPMMAFSVTLSTPNGDLVRVVIAPDMVRAASFADGAAQRLSGRVSSLGVIGEVLR